MTLDQARKVYHEIREIKKRYGISYSDFHEEEREGEVRFVNVTLKLKIDPEKKVLTKKSYFDTYLM
jgi:hypothetical protein